MVPLATYTDTTALTIFLGTEQNTLTTGNGYGVSGLPQALFCLFAVVKYAFFLRSVLVTISSVFCGSSDYFINICEYLLTYGTAYVRPPMCRYAIGKRADITHLHYHLHICYISVHSPSSAISADLSYPHIRWMSTSTTSAVS